jgi:NADPH2:quinone reductase
MVKAWVSDNKGLVLKDIAVSVPQPDEVVIKHKTIGVNNLDILQKDGLMEIGETRIIGCEAFGVVESVGSNVEEFQEGDRVAYCTSMGGSFSEKRVINHKLLVPVPDYIEDDVVSALLLKAMTAHMLLRRTFFVTENSSVLVHDASSGLGQLICVLGQHYEAKVIAVVSGIEQREYMDSLGIKNIIDSKSSNFVEKVNEITGGEGANLIFDYVGSNTFSKSVECVSGFGLIVNMMDSYGEESNFDLNKLFKKSAFITGPNTFIYKQDRAELLLSTNEVFALAQKKVINPNICKIYPFADAKKAIEEFTKGVMGQIIIKI